MHACGGLRDFSPLGEGRCTGVDVPARWTTLPPPGGDAEGRGGSGTIFARSRSHPLSHRWDLPLSLRDISPHWGESKSGIEVRISMNKI